MITRIHASHHACKAQPPPCMQTETAPDPPTGSPTSASSLFSQSSPSVADPMPASHAGTAPSSCSRRRRVMGRESVARARSLTRLVDGGGDGVGGGSGACMTHACCMRMHARRRQAHACSMRPMCASSSRQPTCCACTSRQTAASGAPPPGPTAACARPRAARPTPMTARSRRPPTPGVRRPLQRQQGRLWCGQRLW